jgi:alpha-glucosidase
MTPILIHHQLAPFLEQPPDGLPDGLRLRLWVQSTQPPAEVFLRVEPDNEERLVPMARVSGATRWQVYEADWLPDPSQGVSVYCFKLLWERHQCWLDAAGQSPRMPLRERFFRINTAHRPPDWVPDQVFYQIFPERFRNGDPSLIHPHLGREPRPGQGVIRAKPWGEPIDPQRPNTEIYGGDLPGVVEALDYLQDLGVTALYLNPVFTSPSVHKYDTEDYEHVDPHLGGDAALAELRAATRERGMRFLLDAVFNHTSDTHPWFNRWGTHAGEGAYQSPSAPYRSAYTFANPHDPESYFCWQGSKVLPVLDFARPEVQAYFFDGADAITRRWLREPYAADGWRIDVAHMMGEGTGALHNDRVLGALRRAAKEENPEAYILGEHFFEATRWLQGDLEDGAMNYYGFSHPVRAFLAGQDVNYHPVALDAAELDGWLTDARSRIPYANQLCQLNLLGSHDTARFLTLVGQDEVLMRLALVLLFTYPGVPCIYYGDEIGMTGANDPYNRACFDWEPSRWNQGLQGWVGDLSALRAVHPALRRGGYQTLIAEGDAFGFARFDAGETLIVAINRSDAELETSPLDFDALPWRPTRPATLMGAGSLSADSGRMLLPAKSCLVLHAEVECA